MTRHSPPFPVFAMRVAALVIAAFVLAACAQPTPYAPRTNGEGYAEQEIEPQRYRVTFKGNSATSRERVENALLLRAAEVTRARGQDHFVIVNREIERDVRYRGTHVPSFHGHGFGFHRRGFHGHGFHGHGFHGHGFNTISAYPITRYDASAEIVLRSGPKPDDAADAYDADALLERLRPQLVESDATE